MPTSLLINGGNLEIHANAKIFAVDTVITVFKMADDPKGQSNVYDIKPDGLTFKQPIELCIQPVAGFAVTKDDPACLAYLTETGDLLWGKTDHFSNYGILAVPTDPDACN
ncbi:MAG: hypothetical protein ACI9OJ_002743 [Myxococcota bacterium]|jgi:hypothetical protein